MVFIKVQKTKAYFKRFQTRYRRRREGKTDYYARKRLITQDNDKYNTHKYRFVVRLTHSKHPKVICQIIYATLTGDRILCQATSCELKKYGLEAGLTNYAATYCTGLLLARRLLKQVGMDSLYQGIPKVTGEAYDVSQKPNEERRPFKAVMDVGLIRTTNGNKVFGALKGACDGGLYIPHSTKRFPGFKKTADGESYDAKKHRERIFAGHVDKYMKELKKTEEAYKRQFNLWDACLKKNAVDTCEKLFTKIHDAIRKNPDFVKKAKKDKPKRDFMKKRPKRLNREQRKKNVVKKIEIATKQKSKVKK
jgi:large subunit ribosomal protein L5e